MFLAVLIVVAFVVPSYSVGDEECILKPKAIVKYRVGFAQSEHFQNYASHLYGLLRGLSNCGIIGSIETLPYEEGQEDSWIMWKWLVDNQPSEYIDFVEDAYYNFTDGETRQAEAVERVSKNDDLDAMFVTGTTAGYALSRQEPKVPILVFSASNALASKIVSSSTDSGMDNVWAHLDASRFTNQIDLFDEIFEIKTLGIVIEDSEVGRNFADYDAIAQKCKDVGIELITKEISGSEYDNDSDYQVYKDQIIDIYEDLSVQVDAMYFTSTGELKGEDFEKSISIFYDKKIPIFSQLGGDMVVKGALMSSVGDYSNVGEWGTDVFVKTLMGENPRFETMTWSDTPKIVINLSAARRIDYKPAFEILLSADKIYVNE